MKNLEIAEIFYAMADILEMQGIQWKPQAYRRAAKAIESLSEDIEEIVKRKETKIIPGVGESLAAKIEEYCKTGKIKAYEKLQNKVPKGISELLEIPTIGPKTAKLLYEKLKITTIKKLEQAAKKHKIAKLFGMGEKSEEDILRGISLLGKAKGRTLLGIALPISESIVNQLKQLKEIEQIQPAGSVRRMKETIRDLDILVTSSKPKKVMDFFTKLPEVASINAKGATKSSVMLKNGLQVDVRVVPDDIYGAALQYFTGSKEHSIALRSIAIKKNLKLSEYGIFNRKTNKRVAGKTEKEVYAKLGLPYIEPELRENRGEIQAALKNKLPKLINYNEIKGDFHIHSEYSDGSDKIEDIAKFAKKLGYSYIAICDHSQSQKIAHGLEIKELEEKNIEIDKVNNEVKGIKVLKGTEVDIKADGSLDYPDDILKKQDIVIAAIHSGFKNPKEKMTERIINAMKNKQVDIIAHPTGRLINRREPYAVDLEKIFKVASETKTALEINAFADRLDLNDVAIKKAKECGVKFAIGTDAHSVSHLHYMKLGIATARRGWAEKKDVLNTLSLNELKSSLK